MVICGRGDFTVEGGKMQACTLGQHAKASRVRGQVHMLRASGLEVARVGVRSASSLESLEKKPHFCPMLWTAQSPQAGNTQLGLRVSRVTGVSGTSVTRNGNHVSGTD